MLTHVALLSAHVAHILADVDPMLAQACPYLSLMLAHVAHILADVGPMLTPRPSRCPVFRSGPLPKTQNHEKPMVFYRRQDETRRRRRPQNPVKNDVCLNTTHAEYTVNYNDNREHGVNRNRHEVGRRQGRPAHITFGYQPKASGKDTGCGPGPAPGFMRLTPDSRVPAKADPSARAGVGGVVVVVMVVVHVLVVVVVVVVVGRCWPYLGAVLPLSWP